MVESSWTHSTTPTSTSCWDDRVLQSQIHVNLPTMLHIHLVSTKSVWLDELNKHISLFSHQHKIDMDHLPYQSYCEIALCFHWTILNIWISLTPSSILIELATTCWLPLQVLLAFSISVFFIFMNKSLDN